MAFINKFATLTLINQTIYTAPAGKEAVIHAIFVTPNVPETTVNLNVLDGSLNEGFIGKDLPLVQGGTLYYPKPVNLASGEALQASCSVDDDADILISILEQDAI